MSCTTPSTDRLLSRAEAAALLGLKVVTLEAWASRGNSDLQYIRVGGRAKYRARDIEDYLGRHSGTSAAAIAAAKASSE